MKNNRAMPAPILVALICAALLGANRASAQISTNLQDMMRRINAGEFGGARGGGGGRGARGGGAGRWIEGGKFYTTTERNSDGGSNIVRHDPATDQREVILSAKELTPPPLGRPLAPGDYSSSADGKRLLFATNPRSTMIRKTANDYWVLDRTDHSWRKLGGKTNSGLLYAKLSPDGSRAAYVRDNNLYVETIGSGAIKQLTSDGSPNIINGTSDWVNEEEFSLRDAFEWSPDGRNIAYLQFDQSSVPEFALINYTDALYPVITKYPYPKPGQTNAAVRAGIVSASGGRTRWLKVPGDPRNIYIPRIGWADAGQVILQQLNRLQNTNNVWLADAKNGGLRLMFQDTDTAWVDINERFTWINPGSSRREEAQIKDQKNQSLLTSAATNMGQAQLLFVSERDGWRHAYAISREGDVRLITSGAFDLLSIAGIDEAGGWLYYIASPGNATQRYLVRSRLDGSSEPVRITPADAPGTHTYNLSPDGRWAFHTYSKFDGPGVSDLVSLPDHRAVRVFQDNAELKVKVAAILTNRTELFQVDIGDGVKLDGWLIKPRDLDPAKKYPLIVNVYGEPAATTVNDSWAGSGRLLLSALADDGYLIASFDNRGTPSLKGRAWRKVVYGSVGVLSSKEQAAAVRALAAMQPCVDLDRVGVFGWSGGGSMTLNLMFRHPDLYKVGVAGAPVPDERLYDSIYQERYMGLPEQNAEGYTQGSPITFAGGLQGKLLVIHGTGDDNVHFQGTQRLINKLIELNKQFSFMEYPNRRHGISGEHLDTLRYGFFEEYLPAGGR
jgi:dipeptidyl-peptidase 4